MSVQDSAPTATGEQQSPVQDTGAQAGRPSRIYFGDYLRAAIVCLVILHHTAITYGASGSFYYTEAATDPAAAGLLSLLTNFDQAWFMGAFFLISGYFVPASFDRKGVRRYLRDRLIRLGIPLLVFYFVLNPLTVYIAFSHTPAAQLAQQGFTIPVATTWQFYVNTVGIGPLWFVEMLLLFEFGWAAWYVAKKRIKPQGSGGLPFPSYRRICAFIAVLAASAYLLRIVIPINAQVLGFPSLFDLPQYLSFFIVGTVAGRGDWLRKMPTKLANHFADIALIASVTLLPLSIVGTGVTSLGWGSLLGGGTVSSAIYALWDSAFAVGFTMFAIAFFRKRYDRPGRLWSFASKHFYTAYILQAPIIVAITAVMLSPVHLESLLKFFLAAVIVLPCIWGAAYLVRKIPFADRIL
jgi:hypothetical protein